MVPFEGILLTKLNSKVLVRMEGKDTSFWAESGWLSVVIGGIQVRERGRN